MLPPHRGCDYRIELEEGQKPTHAKSYRMSQEELELVKDYMNEQRRRVKIDGFVTTLFGRRINFPNAKSSNPSERAFVERASINAPIQGTAADMIKLAMLDAHRALKGSNTRMLLNVHDELVFEMPPGDEALVPKLKSAMEEALPLKVPIEVDAKLGEDWLAMTPVV